MNTGEALAALLVQISTIVGVQVSIWWPRKAEEGSPKGRAFLALRRAAACLTLGYVLILIVITMIFGLPREGNLVQKIVFLAVLGTLPLTPLSSVALSIERGRRVRALVSSYGALLLAAVLAWVCLYFMVAALIIPDFPRWLSACVIVATLCCGAGVTFIMELYAAIRYPKAA